MTTPAALALLLALAVIAGVTALRLAPGVEAPETVHIAAGPQDYRPAGEFRQGTRMVDAPMERVEAPALEVMKFHVSEAEYARCVADRGCPPLPVTGRPGMPQTNINHADATAYAAWLSARTGATWRLPTDAEWLRAAGERGFDDGFAEDANGADPSRRWIANYLREVELRGEADLALHPQGHFGVNDRGVADIAGNVWEWTETCFQNGTLTPDGTAIATRADYCGVRSVQGKHRAFVIDFIRDARVGGCAAGVPPDYLGFRLVRDAG
ncbi:SUMF1/EgtB/PvdO family nonheme iron enzyme [Frigidibacter albus]|uniref:SUMF1/EgtB/PvdO family nonheme iron enzyme n=1 Tax=Frigidibacter albus TaxID=1465486 RepID=A0A6L8VDU5_9RHOB|nr:SUMF1/EgtB/PvdO family nonheme iron enzyme [Frigidibacter albus]MZQ88498.1 SUMF1/EgtB/PvdO family nonheme iron enzyme [Frigidibacter albus]NBE30693.1 SUMF1/EgtB/PvdO family nonheme iron enzyme [Frigidibacter albus]GGH48698.1 nitrate reductase [Frigidibacter albus]